MLENTNTTTPPKNEIGGMRCNPYLDYLIWLNQQGLIKVNINDFMNVGPKQEYYIPEGEGNPVGFTIETKEQYDLWLAMQGYYWVFPY